MNSYFEVIVYYDKEDFRYSDVFCVKSLEEVKNLPFYKKPYRCFIVEQVIPKKYLIEDFTQHMGVGEYWNELRSGVKKVLYARNVTIEEFIRSKEISEFDRNFIDIIKNIFDKLINKPKDFLEIANKLEKLSMLSLMELCEGKLFVENFIIMHYSAIVNIYLEAVDKFDNTQEIKDYVFKKLPIGYYTPKDGMCLNMACALTIEDFDKSVRVYEKEFNAYIEEQAIKRERKFICYI